MFNDPTPVDHQPVWPLSLMRLTGPLDALRTTLDEGRLTREVLNTPDERGMTLLHAFAPRRRGVKALMQAVLIAGANPDLTDNACQSAAHHAVHHDNPTLLLALHQAGANLNALDTDGDTPLHLACLYGRYRLIAALLRMGVDLRPTSHDGQEPLAMLPIRGGPDHLRARARLQAAIVAQEQAGLRQAIGIEQGKTDANPRVRRPRSRL